MHALLASVAPLLRHARPVAVLALHPAPALRHPHSVVQPAAAWRTATVRACAVEEEAGIRVNKALRATHSRREADRLIDAGRVTVNAVAATSGDRLVRGDAVCLDGLPVDWERLNPPPAAAGGGGGEGEGQGEGSRFVYLKYWKPRGVVCTTDRRQRGNILDELGPLPGVTDRVYPIGRLDAESTGLLLLTSDGGIVNGLLRSSERKSKTYVVTTETRATDAQVARQAQAQPKALAQAQPLA